MITITSDSNFKRTAHYFRRSRKSAQIRNAASVAELCRQRLEKATPSATGLTASSWTYKIERRRKRTMIHFDNTNIQNGIKIALILEYGHASRGGGWVSGQHFIDPAVQKTYNEVIDKTWKEMTRL